MRRAAAFFKALCVTALCAACAAFAYLLHAAPVFGGEGYELYLGTSSAPVLSTDTPLADKLLQSTFGESARFEGDRYGELKERFRAELLFTETACGVTNYYLYSPLLGDCVSVSGRAVNLHIAVREGRTAAGTPLIFGGF